MVVILMTIFLKARQVFIYIRPCSIHSNTLLVATCAPLRYAPVA